MSLYLRNGIFAECPGLGRSLCPTCTPEWPQQLQVEVTDEFIQFATIECMYVLACVQFVYLMYKYDMHACLFVCTYVRMYVLRITYFSV
jgi:hypothetical protein